MSLPHREHVSTLPLSNAHRPTLIIALNPCRRAFSRTSMEIHHLHYSNQLTKNSNSPMCARHPASVPYTNTDRPPSCSTHPESSILIGSRLEGFLTAESHGCSCISQESTNSWRCASSAQYPQRLLTDSTQSSSKPGDNHRLAP